MSAWRRAAIERLPKLRAVAERSESVGMFWVELWWVFVDAHKEPLDEGTIAGTYAFASWTLLHGDSDAAAGTVCHFFEHLPTEALVRQRMHRYLSHADFVGMIEAFKYFLSPKEFDDFVASFESNRKQYEREVRQEELARRRSGRKSGSTDSSGHASR